MPDPTTLTNLTLDVHRDDGVIVYLNGTEVLRDNMPGGAVTFATTASGNADGNVSATVSPALMVTGTNIIAAEIHQASPTSSDIGFWATLTGTSTSNLTDLELIYIASPSDKDVIVQTSSVPIIVNAFKNNGMWTNVEFFVDGSKLSEDTTHPFTANWPNPPLGWHVITVVAHDQSGGSTSPPAVRVEIVPSISGPTGTNQTLIAQGAGWNYLDDGSDQGTAWKEFAFDDSSWASGPAKLGYNNGEVTTISFGPDANNKYVTSYFRHAFVFNDVNRVESVLVRLLRDDGGVVYINGTEVFRSNMPGGPIAYNTFAGGTVGGGAENQFFSMSVSPSVLLPGTNVVAVEIHQANATSSDLSFDFSLDVQLSPPAPPGVEITSPSNNALLEPAPIIPILADARASSGESIINITFYVDGLPLGLDATEPYSFDWLNPATGNYTLTTVSTESGGLVQTSTPVQVTIDFPGEPHTLISTVGDWKYLDTGITPVPTWTEVGYNDSKWLLGPARLGYGGDGEATEVGFGSDPARKHITTWFRKTFVVGDPSGFGALRLRLQRDDGALVYLNGVEVFRDNLISGPINPNSFAASDIDGADETEWLETQISSALLQSGSNTVAVEIHQSRLDSPDLGFNLELTGLMPTSLVSAVYLTEPGDGSVHSSAEPLRLTAFTFGLNNISNVEFFSGLTKLGEHMTHPYTYDWPAPTTGSHMLTARVTYDGGSVLTSDPVSILVVTPSPTVTPVQVDYIVSGSDWRYNDSGVDLGTAWKETGFNDGGWLLGPARLGYGLDGEVTTINAGPPTTYYRRSFNIPDPSLLNELVVRIQRDDGAVVYLNGT
ncbi:MAG: Ig-like domain-containing protein, partial [Verrucomicrobiota bacterium]